MSDHVLLVLTNPTPGVEDEYDDWRASVRNDDVVAAPGLDSTRMRLPEAFDLDCIDPWCYAQITATVRTNRKATPRVAAAWNGSAAQTRW